MRSTMPGWLPVLLGVLVATAGIGISVWRPWASDDERVNRVTAPVGVPTAPSVPVPQGGVLQDPGTTEAQRELAAEQASAEARREIARARATAASATAARNRAEAPSHIQVVTAAQGCYCTAGRHIVVTCGVTSQAAVPAWATVGARAHSGTMGVAAQGQSYVALQPGQTAQVEVTAPLTGAWFDCSSATGCECWLATAGASDAPSRSNN